MDEFQIPVLRQARERFHNETLFNHEAKSEVMGTQYSMPSQILQRWRHIKSA
jgi:hypothetical protein